MAAVDEEVHSRLNGFTQNCVIRAGIKRESAKARKSIGIKCESARESTFAFYTPSLQ